MSSYLALAAASMGIIMAVAPLLQLRLILQERDAREVSRGFLAIIGFGNLIWIAYGIDTSNEVIIVPNVCGFLCSYLTLAAAFYFRAGDPSRTD